MMVVPDSGLCLGYLVQLLLKSEPIYSLTGSLGYITTFKCIIFLLRSDIKRHFTTIVAFSESTS